MAEAANSGLGDIDYFRKHLADCIGTEEFPEIGKTAELRDLQETDQQKNGGSYLLALAECQDAAEGKEDPEIFDIEPDEISLFKETKQQRGDQKGQGNQCGKGDVDKNFPPKREEG